WVLRIALQTARRMADAPRRAVEGRFLYAAHRLGYEEETLGELWDAAPRRFRAAWQDAISAGADAPPFGVRIAKENAAPPLGESLSRLLGGADSLPGAASPGDFPLPDFLQRAVSLARTEQTRRQRRLRLREAVLVLLVAAFVLAGMRIGQVLDPHHATPAATQVVVVEIQPTPVVVTVIPTPIARYPQKPVFWRVQPGDTLPALAQRFGVSVDDLLAWNHLDDANAALEAGQLLVVRAAADGTQVASLGTLSDAPTPLPPLSASADAADVLNLMKRSEAVWRTLWVDAFITDYGPEGYTGAPRITRQQAWLTKNGRSLVLSGGVGDFGTRAWLSMDGIVYGASLPEARFKATGHHDDYAEAVSVDVHLGDMLFAAQYLLTEPPPLRIVGRTQVAGRDAVQMDVIRPGGVRETWWVDAQFGLLLRRQVFSRRGVLLSDVQVSRLA
ncbi:MAG: LysM peptidoglycan-binding domain-containing protein, partial [Anaerolineae bacterium]